MDVAPLDWRPDAVFVQAGASQRDAQVAGLGVRWSWPLAPAGFSAVMELSASRWSTGLTPSGVPVIGRDHPVQLVVMPLVRWQPQSGGSPWYVEAGLGLSWHDRTYRVERKHQGSRLNFQEEVALGRMLGGGHALSLRLAHMSNAGLRKPNPGETWWSLRWEVAF